MSKIHHFKGFSVVDGDMKIKLNMSRFSKQYQEAQYLLDGMVMDSMVPFMPKISGNFINRTRIQRRNLNIPNGLTHGHKLNGLMPQNDNTAVHGFAK